MGRWKSERNYNGDYEVITGKSLRGVTFANPIGADMVISAHNADCDAYEARIAELEALVARVKADSLRVVEDGEACDILAAKSQYVTDEDGELWECHPEPADDGREVRSVLTGCGGYFAATVVQPVRLERWEDGE